MIYATINYHNFSVCLRMMYEVQNSRNKLKNLITSCKIFEAMERSKIGILCLFFILFTYNAFGAEPDTLWIIDVSENFQGELPSSWKHILPKKHRAYTNYSIEQDIEGPYLRALSGATASWLELELKDIDISKYQTMEWVWKVVQFPETEWEMNPSHDDFAIRIELIYDYKGGKKNILNFVRKGLITSIFKRYPPELLVSYVWSLNVPVNKPYQSLHSKRMMIIPIESDVVLQGRWVNEKRNIKDDLDFLKGKKSSLVLTKIRIRSDTDNLPSIAESGIKRIYLTIEKPERTEN